MAVPCQVGPQESLTGIEKYIERLEGKIRDCLFFYVKIFENNSVSYNPKSFLSIKYKHFPIADFFFYLFLLLLSLTLSYLPFFESPLSFCIFRVKIHSFLQCTDVSTQSCQSPSNKVLRWAIFIVQMTPSPNLYCAHWSNKDGSPQDLYKLCMHV